MLRKKIEDLLLSVTKPARYIGGESGSVIKNKDNISVRFAFCFPDTYDIVMSHLGMKILYSLINQRADYWCERVFAPGIDFEKLMRENRIPLYALESLDPLSEFDFIGFTMQYELSYTNVLNMLDLAGIPILSKDRDDKLTNIIVAGGPCVCNPEPLADFIDLFILGEGEEVNLELMDLYKKMKSKDFGKKDFLRRAAEIDGIYVPSLYKVYYNDDGTVKEIIPQDNVRPIIKKRIIKDFDKVFYPENFVVPFTDIVHDRISVEVLRGCIRGCRFCQAGFLYRPFREKSPETVCREAETLCGNTGYEEISLASLSTSDHSEIGKILTELIPYTEKQHINLSLPSLRVDNFSKELMDEVKKVRKSGLTFAPEAGTQRLRNVINKNVTEEEVMRTCRTAFEGGYTSVKLYFMLGLPTETDEDIVGITKLAQKIVDLYYSIPGRQKGKGVQVSISTATFVPKPFTPFEFEPQATRSEIMHKQETLMNSITSKKIKASWHDPSTSILEAALARGDRRMGTAVYRAWEKGCKFDSWGEHFSYEKWREAFEESGLDMEFYACRRRDYEEIMPWDHLDYYINKEFLVRENIKAKRAETTENCRSKCSACGVSREIGGPCFG